MHSTLDIFLAILFTLWVVVGFFFLTSFWISDHSEQDDDAEI